MTAKERFSNPTCGDTINLRLFTYNSNNRRDVLSITKVDIYVIDSEEVSAENPDGLRLIETIEGADVTKEDTGQYLLQIDAATPTYTIGQYRDVWTVVLEDTECSVTSITNYFNIYSNLWFTSTTPTFYDFNFNFRPNRFRKGSKRYLIIEVTPNVPRGADIQPYYENLAIVSDIRVSIEIACGECVPAESDLRLVVDRQLVDYREKCFAYYFLDTTELDLGIYDIWFETTFGENVFISDKNSFQIFE